MKEIDIRFQVITIAIDNPMSILQVLLLLLLQLRPQVSLPLPLHELNKDTLTTTVFSHSLLFSSPAPFSSSLPSPLCCRPTPHLILLSTPLHGDKEHTFMPSVFLDSTLSPISFFLCLYCCVVVLLCVSSCVLRLLRLLRLSLSLPNFCFPFNYSVYQSRTKLFMF